MSSRLRGRSRSASGDCRASASRAAAANRSSLIAPRRSEGEGAASRTHRATRLRSRCTFRAVTCLPLPAARALLSMTTTEIPVDAAYRDASRSTDERVDDLLARMTLDEKLAQLGGVWVTELVVDDRFDRRRGRRAKLRHGIGHVTRIGASTGLRPAEQRGPDERASSGSPSSGPGSASRWSSTRSRPAGTAPATPPCSRRRIGLASTWDPELVEEVGRRDPGADARRRRPPHAGAGARRRPRPPLGPGRGDLRRGPVPGRHASARPTSAACRPTTWPAASIATGKHFLGYGLPEGGMNHAPVHLGPRELREVYAEPFAAAIRDAGLASVMNSLQLGRRPAVRRRRPRSSPTSCATSSASTAWSWPTTSRSCCC